MAGRSPRNRGEDDICARRSAHRRLQGDKQIISATLSTSSFVDARPDARRYLRHPHLPARPAHSMPAPLFFPDATTDDVVCDDGRRRSPACDSSRWRRMPSGTLTWQAFIGQARRRRRQRACAKGARFALAEGMLGILHAGLACDSFLYKRSAAAFTASNAEIEGAREDAPLGFTLSCSAMPRFSFRMSSIK